MIFNDFGEQQRFFDNIISIINHNKLTHAYLIETNGYYDKNKVIDLFVGLLYSYPDVASIEQIKADGNYIEIGIDSSSSVIKKAQILEIQEKFMTKSLNNKPRIYVINDADKLNEQASNSLLKFLEEPQPGIIGILVSDSRYRVLETLQSRCQIFSLVNENSNYTFDNLDFIAEFIKMIEKRKSTSISYVPILCNNEYYTRDKWLDIFKAMQIIYYQALRKKIGVVYQNDLDNIIDYINEFNSIDLIVNKIDILTKQIDKLVYNLNVNLMLDQFIINFSGVDVYD